MKNSKWISGAVAVVVVGCGQGSLSAVNANEQGSEADAIVAARASEQNAAAAGLSSQQISLVRSSESGARELEGRAGSGGGKWKLFPCPAFMENVTIGYDESRQPADAMWAENSATFAVTDAEVAGGYDTRKLLACRVRYEGRLHMQMLAYVDSTSCIATNDRATGFHGSICFVAE